MSVPVLLVARPPEPLIAPPIDTVLEEPATVSRKPPLVTLLTMVKPLVELFVQLCAAVIVIGTAFEALPIVTAPAPALTTMPEAPIDNAWEPEALAVMVVAPVLANVMPAIVVGTPS